MKIYEFEKQGIKFFFRNPEFNQYGKLVMKYKILGIKENKHDSEGYFFNSEFLPDKNVMSFYDVKINGKNVGGVGLPEDILKDIKSLLDQFKTDRENNTNQVVSELVEGKRKIHFGIVGCDYPYYQAWVKNLPEDLSGLEQSIMEKAIEIIMGKDEWVSNSCDYLQKIVNKSIGTVEKLKDVLNPEFNIKSQEYYSYEETVVTGFEMSLPTILQPVLEKRAEYKKKIDDIFTMAKETKDPQIIRQWMDDCNQKNIDCSFDCMYEYAMPDGSRKIERIHCY